VSEPNIFFVFEHGGERQRPTFDTDEAAWEAGDEFAACYEGVWGFHRPITVIKVTEEVVSRDPVTSGSDLDSAS
jgi:hypothetical protein